MAGGWTRPSGARAPLSPREQQILGLLAGGRTQKETAFELGVADATVRVLYSRAMKKLGRSKHPRAQAIGAPLMWIVRALILLVAIVAIVG